MTSLPHNATDDTTRSSRPVQKGLLLLGVPCVLFLSATSFLQHTRFVTAAARNDLQVAPTIDTSATATEPDLNLAILEIAH